MKSARLYFMIVLFAGTGALRAQSNQMLRSQALQAVADKDWYAASQYYSRLFPGDTSNISLAYKYAEVCRLNYETDLAVRLYKRVVNSARKKKYPLALYWLGQLEKTRGHYAEAKTWFAAFRKLELKDDKYHYYILRAKQELDYCDYADALVHQPVISAVSPIKGSVNSKLSEYAPYEHDSTLYFSSIRPPSRRAGPGEPPTYSKIYTSQVRNGRYLKMKTLDSSINATRYHQANICFSPDKKEMILARCQAKNAAEFNCELFASRFNNKRWFTPQRLPEPLNDTTATTTQPNFGLMDGRTVLFFSSNRQGGEGGMDIWYCFRNGDGSYGQPVNAGKKINTADDEITPWFDTEAQALFFSSSYHFSLGGFDIFRSAFSAGGFGEPVNVGFPINTGYNETYYSVNNTGTRVYFSSNRPGSQFDGLPNCCNDIYAFDIDTASPPPVTVIDTNTISKEQIRLLVPLTLFFHNDEPVPRSTDTVTKQTYRESFEKYLAMVPQYRREYSKGLKGEQKDSALKDQEIFFSDSVGAGYDKLERFADLLLKVLQNGETVVITMKGYCSPLASSDYNIRLAKRRISSLRNYFMSTRDSVFSQYVNRSDSGGKIIFVNEEIGELSQSRVSDDLKDKRNSVFSPAAASERKIQIIAVSFK